MAEHALANKKFLTRAVFYVASHGVRQFLDVGAGLPTSPARAGSPAPWLATHRAAGTVLADPVVAYVDYDPVAVAHSQALLTEAGSGPQVVAVGGDMRDPAAILAHHDIRAAGFDPNVPACVILACVLHFVDAQTADAIVTAAEALAPGSYLVISVGFAKGQGGDDFASTYNAQGGPGSTLNPGSRSPPGSTACSSCRPASWTAPPGDRNGPKRCPRTDPA
ncbi:MAG: SAM-dependent methyltransferase [Actinomycetota bacterium]|nr:SAM-dependent methyltransferase [Actinomycetota bacterium]